MTRSSRTRTLPAARLLARVLVALLVAPPVWATPTGEEVVAGSVAFGRAGKTTYINPSDGAIIEWQDFDIGTGETVHFIQPGEWARVLNRVVGGNATQIDGSLYANGQVYIANQHGVFFGANAIVDVGRLVAGAGNISNEDFIGGVDRFTELGGTIENAGTIQADAVALLGARVANHGLVSVDEGSIVMLAGEEIWIAQHGSPVLIKLDTSPEWAQAHAGPDAAVQNSGTLDAGRGQVRMAAGDLVSLAIHNSGSVYASDIELAGGAGSIVHVEGVLDVSDTSAGARGGRIAVDGERIALEGALLDASGDVGGGTIHVGGGPRGAGASAQFTLSDAQSELLADALTRGDGGEIVLWAEDSAWIHSLISARGGAAGGDGGFAETSGKIWLDVKSTPSLGAAAGNGGEWLIDPGNITIYTAPQGPGDPDPNLDTALDNLLNAPAGSSGVLRPDVGESGMTTQQLATVLGDGVNVTLTTELQGGTPPDCNGATGCGVILLEGDLSIGPNPQGRIATLTLIAANKVDLLASIDAGDLILNINVLANDTDQPQTGVPFPDPMEATPSRSVTVDGDVDTGGGFLALAGANVEVRAGHTIDTGGGVVDIVARGGDVTLDSAIDTQGGSVSAAGDAIDLDADGVLEGGDIDALAPITTDGGSVSLASRGGHITVSAAIDTEPAIAGAGFGGVFLGAGTDTEGMEQGGDVSVNASLRSAAAPIVVGGAGSVDIQADITTTEGGDVEIGGAAVDSIDFLAKQITVNGNITTDATEDGNVQIFGGVPEDPPPMTPRTLSLLKDISAGEGDVSITFTHDVSLTDATIEGSTVNITAGSDGTGDLSFLNVNNATNVIRATELGLAAGNGYTAPAPPGGVDDPALRASQIVNGVTNLTATDATAGVLAKVQYFQDARLDDASTPDFVSSNAGLTDLVLQSGDDVLQVSNAAKVAGTNLILVGGRAEAGVTEAVSVTTAIGVESLDVRVAEDFRVTAALTDNVNDTKQISITSGLNAGAESTTAGEVLGDLTLPDGTLLRATDLATNESSLSLHAGANGFGNLIFETGTADLGADSVSLRAGDGPGGQTASAIEFQDLANSTIDIGNTSSADFSASFRQDAPIDNAGLPDVDTARDSETLVAYRSDDGAATLSDETLVADRHLSLIGRSVAIDIDAADRLDLLSAELGQIGYFTVTQPLLDEVTFIDPVASNYTPTNRLVLRAAIGTPGSLNFASGATVRADDIRLVASDGAGGSVTSTVIPVGALFQGADPLAPTAPRIFAIQQDAMISSAPTASQFPAGLPQTLALRSDDVGIDIDGANDLPSATKTVLMAPSVTLSQSDGDLAVPSTLEISATNARLEASSASEDALVMAANAEFGAFDPDPDELLYDSAADPSAFDPAAARRDSPDSVTIAQDATVTSGNLPIDGAFGTDNMTEAGNPLQYALETRHGNVELDDPDQVRDTELVLRLTDDDHTNVHEVKLGDGMAYSLGSLAIEAQRGLAVADDFSVTAAGAIFVRSGLADVADLVFADRDNLGSLDFTGNATLTGRSVDLSAGTALSDLSGVKSLDLPEVEASNLTVVLNDAEGSFSLSQDAGLDQAASTLPTLSVAAAGDRVDSYTLTSRRENIRIDDVENLDAMGTDLIDNLRFNAGSSVVVDGAGNVLGINSDGDFVDDMDMVVAPEDTSVEPALAVIGSGELSFIDFDQVVLSAPQVLLESENGSVQASELAVAGPNPGEAIVLLGDPEVGASPSAFTIKQTAAFGPTLSGLPERTQFQGPVAGVSYTLESEAPDFTLDTALADLAGGTNLTLRVPGTVDVEVDTSDTGADDPAFVSLVIEGPTDPAFVLDTIRIDTPELETAGSQRYGGMTTLLRDVNLIGTNLQFDDTLNGQQALTLSPTGVAFLTKDVGDTTPLQRLQVLFRDGGALQFGSSDTPDADIAVHVLDDLRIGTIDGSQPLGDPATATPALGRSTSPSIATVFVRANIDPGTGIPAAVQPNLTLHATDIEFGEGEKVSVPGIFHAAKDATTASTSVTIGDAAADIIDIDAVTLQLVRRVSGSVLKNDGSGSGDGGTDWNANVYLLDGVTGPLVLGGGGRNPVIGVQNGFNTGTTRIDPATSMPYDTSAAETLFQGLSKAALKADFTPIVATDFVFENSGSPIALDIRPLGPPASDLSEVYFETGPRPALPHAREADAPGEGLRLVGIEPRPETPNEQAGRARGAGIYDDLSSDWQAERSDVVRIAATRVDGGQAARARELYLEVLGAELEKAPALRETLAGAVEHYRDVTGARRVVGFELRRFLRNRPSSAFEAYQVLLKLDELFAAHRHSGLVRAEYLRVQRPWVEAITPEGITPDEMAQAIHPSRYVRGSDILDVFGR